MAAEQYARVRLSHIDPPSHQLRNEIDPERLGELADSMAAEGLHQAIGLRGPNDADRFEIIWGHRRFLAARSLNWPDIPARVFPWSYDPLLAAVSENLQREQLNPLEEARAVQRMHQAGHPLVAIQRLFRRSPAWVRARLDLLETPPDIQDAVSTKTLPLAVASALARIDHEDYRRALIEEAQRVGASAATVEVWVSHYQADRARIITNRDTVETIMSRREAWVIYTPCDSCQKQTDYRTTRSYRFCAACSADVDAAIQGTPGPGDSTPPSSHTAHHNGGV